MTCRESHAWRGVAAPAGWFLAFLFAGASGPAAPPRAGTPRLTVAVLPFEDQTRDPAAAHWRHGLERLLRNQVAEVKALRLVPAGANDFACRQLQVEPGGPLTAAQARQMGELIEARRVVWGSYRREAGQWLVTARVLNVAAGTSSGALEAAAADWFEVRDRLMARVLAELRVQPGPEERRKLRRRPTPSSAAWGWYSRALALQNEDKPWPDQEAAVRHALEADPQFVQGHLGLGAVLLSQGQMEPALAALRRALKIDPDLSEARLGIGIVLLFQEKWSEAEHELREARRLDPDAAEAPMRLGELQAAQGRLEEAMACWNEALPLEPTSGLIHAHLGEGYARQGRRALALLELKEAERLDPDTVTVQIVARGYDALHDTPAALERFEKFIVLARKLGGNPAVVRHFEERAAQLRATLIPHEVAAAMPKVYTDETLNAALRERLTPEELKLVVNPFASTPDMKHVALTLTLGASDDMGKAKKLVDALARHLDPGLGGSRTARDVFAAWNDPGVSFRCQEYARFYVALAREAGLKAFFVLVEKNQEGSMAPHACAAVFAQGRAWLADPTCRWLGVPHQQFTVMDDLQALAVYLHQQEGDIPRRRLAVKLQPDSALAQFNLAMALMSDQRVNEARLVLNAGLRLEPDGWMGHCTQAYFAGFEKQWAQAEEHLRRAVILNPDYDQTHFFLAEALRAQGKLAPAREEYRAFLRYPSEPLRTEAAHHAIALISEKLGTE